MVLFLLFTVNGGSITFVFAKQRLLELPDWVLSDYTVQALNTTDKETKVQRDSNNLPKD